MSKLPNKIKLVFENGIALENVTVAQNEMSRFLGLLPKSQPLLANEGLLLTNCGSVHGFFMRITIDVVFLNKNWEIVKLVPNCRPWRYVLVARKGKYALETKAGNIQQLQLKIGMKTKILNALID